MYTHVYMIPWSEWCNITKSLANSSQGHFERSLAQGPPGTAIDPALNADMQASLQSGPTIQSAA